MAAEQLSTADRLPDGQNFLPGVKEGSTAVELGVVTGNVCAQVPVGC